MYIDKIKEIILSVLHDRGCDDATASATLEYLESTGVVNFNALSGVITKRIWDGSTEDQELATFEEAIREALSNYVFDIKA